MKNLSLFLNILLLIAVVYLGYLHFTTNPEETPAPEVLEVDPTPAPMDVDGKSIEANSTNGDAAMHAEYKISDRVCVLNKWSGTITDIQWSKKVENLIVYQVEVLKDGDVFEVIDCYTTEIIRGNCSNY